MELETSHFGIYDDGTNSQQLCRGASKETLVAGAVWFDEHNLCLEQWIVAPDNKVVKMLQGKMDPKEVCTKAAEEIRNQNVTEYPANPLKG